MSEKKLKATHQGELHLGEVEIPAFVLEDGRRLISQTGLIRGIGMSKGGGVQGKSRISTVIDVISKKGLNLEKLRVQVDSPIIFSPPKGGRTIYGYEASILADLCEMLLNARQQKLLSPAQIKYADFSEMMMRSLAKVGIIALVDEATGYQYDRERNELQKILKAYISEELLAWQKRFPDIFYKEIFRLNGWDYTVSDIKKRPGVIGKWTNKIIYEQLPKGVLKELKDKTPKSESGNYTARFHQSLTHDIGNPHLQNQINSVIPLMQISDNWKQFLSNFNKMVDRRNGQTELKFEDLEYKGEPKKVETNKFNKELKGLLSVPKPDKE
jgi:hypothetical protein